MRRINYSKHRDTTCHQRRELKDPICRRPQDTLDADASGASPAACARSGRRLTGGPPSRDGWPLAKRLPERAPARSRCGRGGGRGKRPTGGSRRGSPRDISGGPPPVTSSWLLVHRVTHCILFFHVCLRDTRLAVKGPFQGFLWCADEKHEQTRSRGGGTPTISD